MAPSKGSVIIPEEPKKEEAPAEAPAAEAEAPAEDAEKSE